MKEVILALAVVLAAALVGIRMLAAGAGQAQAVEGDLVLDWATTDNTPTSAGTIDSGCQEVLSSAGTVRIDVVAVNANDWAGMDFVFIYPSPVTVDRPGPGDGVLDQEFDPAAGFDFVPVDISTGANLGSNNLMSSAAGSAVDYSVTDVVPDGSSPHGVSLFDNGLFGESGDGGLARLTLDISLVLPGFHTLSLGLTSAFAGGVHSDASGFVPDNAPADTLPFASVQMAVDQSCADAPTPAPTLAPGATPGDGDGAPVGAIVGGVVGGVLLLAVGGGVGYWYLRMRKM